jgi:hypothetical protein
VIEKWLTDAKAALEEEVQSEAGYILMNGVPAAKGPRNIINSMVKRSMAPHMVKPKEVPNDRLTAVTIFKEKPYMHLKHSIIYPHIRKIYENYMKQTIKFRDPSTLLPSHVSPFIQIMSFEMAIQVI